MRVNESNYVLKFDCIYGYIYILTYVYVSIYMYLCQCMCVCVFMHAHMQGLNMSVYPYVCPCTKIVVTFSFISIIEASLFTFIYARGGGRYEFKLLPILLQHPDF